MKIFVHLAHGAGRRAWKARWQTTLGVNHDNLYGYDQAEQMGCTVERSEDAAEGRCKRLFRMGLRRLVGFDMLHTWANRDGILAADVVWTHTEMEAMAVLLLFRLQAGSYPKLLAQIVWLIDAWQSYSAVRRFAYRKLLIRADMLTFLSPLNHAKAQLIFPGQATAFVRFGIRSDVDLFQPRLHPHEPLRVLTVGNDRHRDWQTFVAAFRDDPHVFATMVVSRNAPELNGIENIQREQPKHNGELYALFRWADLMVVPLKANLHASGITAIQEAVLFGLPVICTDTGGLKAYFSEEEVTYVALGDAGRLREAAADIRRDPALYAAKAARALARITDGLNSKSFVKAHVVLSRELLHKDGAFAIGVAGGAS